MTRPLRLQFPGAIYHITSRGNARENIYLDKEDRETFLSILADTVARHNWLCHAYCLMDNHYHLLIETLDPTLSLGMRQLNGVYTQTFNRSHDRVGHIFQGRYKSILVEMDSHLLELCRYIVLNPAKAGMAKTPEQWEWSSYRATVGASKTPDFLSTDWILQQFSRNKAKARGRYADFVRDGMNNKLESPWQKLKGQIFGSSRFIAMMQEKVGEKKEIGEIPREQRYPDRPSLHEIFKTVENKQDRNRKMTAAHRDYGYTLKEIAEAVGVHYATVSRAARRIG